MVELKNGESFNGHLIDCDTFMNITLREVYQTSAESDRFWKLKEVYIRGSTVCRFALSISIITYRTSRRSNICRYNQRSSMQSKKSNKGHEKQEDPQVVNEVCFISVVYRERQVLILLHLFPTSMPQVDVEGTVEVSRYSL
jgi:small nuclear ribonucleoprotein (snRNP)-like protein